MHKKKIIKKLFTPRPQRTYDIYDRKIKIEKGSRSPLCSLCWFLTREIWIIVGNPASGSHHSSPTNIKEIVSQ